VTSLRPRMAAYGPRCARRVGAATIIRSASRRAHARRTRGWMWPRPGVEVTTTSTATPEIRTSRAGRVRRARWRPLARTGSRR
jgi:hypothetical protein